MLRLSTLLLSWVLLLLMAGCSAVADADMSPACASDFSATLVAQLSVQPKQNPVAEVTQYTYQGQTVYLVTGGGNITSNGSTNLNYLFDACGNVLCAASGGPNGSGDGRCPGFAANATNPVLIWRDPR
jgi:hypothetical protein